MKLGKVAEELRCVTERLRSLAEELRDAAGKRGKADAFQKNSGESRGRADEKPEKGSTSPKNVLTLRGKAGGGRDYSPSSSLFLETMAVNSIK